MRIYVHIFENKEQLLFCQSLLLLFSCKVLSDSFATQWTVACQAPLSMEFPWQDYWSGLQFPSAGNLPNSATEPTSPALADRFFTADPPGKSPATRESPDNY